MLNARVCTLPGGYWSGEQLEKTVTWRALDGYTEQTLLDLHHASGSTPERVSEILGLLIERLGELPFDAAMADDLCIADRQWLMLQLSRDIQGDQQWLTFACSSCAAAIDIHVDLSELPVKPSGANYPHPACQIKGQTVCLSVPSGRTQSLAVGASDQRQATAALLKSCVLSVGNEAPSDAWLASLNDQDIAHIEESLEQGSPELSTAIVLDCPECNTTQVVRLNPYGLFDEVRDGLLEEVHLLAWYYHWSEHDILSLPRQRRRHYLQLVDHARGMVA